MTWKIKFIQLKNISLWFDWIEGFKENDLDFNFLFNDLNRV
jgi:hypothetical protein